MITNWITKECETIAVRLWIAGDFHVAKQLVREYCMKGLCVTVAPVSYIYTGGEEAGILVTLINYPRFPTNENGLVYDAEQLGFTLMEKLCQQSFCVQGPSKTVWYSRRKEDVS